MQQQDQIENGADMPQTHDQSRRLFRYYYSLVALLIAMLGSFWLGFEKGKTSSEAPSQATLGSAVLQNVENRREKVDFSLFWDVWNLLKDKYVDGSKLEAQRLMYGAIKGMLSATGDPYTAFLDPEENKKFSEDITGSFEGIGAELGVKGGILTVIAPLEGTPAEKAGLRAGDKIARIDGDSTVDMTVEEAVDRIRGPKGTQVALEILRSGEQETREIKVERNVINVKSVESEMKNGGVAYIKITRFGEDTDREFKAALDRMLSQKPSSMVLDLRNNPGGYLLTSIDVASKLLPRDEVVVIEESGDKKQQKMFTQGGDRASGFETVVLINEGSASASEILAGALKDNRANVTLVGKKSFGKGSVQEFVEMPRGTAAKITVARWLTPSGKQINEEGIHPDVEVELTNEDFDLGRDPQLDKALEILKEKLKK